MSVKVTTLEREFVFEGHALPDPNPIMSVEQVREMYIPTSRNHDGQCHWPGGSRWQAALHIQQSYRLQRIEMQRADETTRLLRAFERAASQARSADAQLLRELEKCQSSKAACALLVSAISLSQSAGDRDEMLTADPGWIHPFV